jgi:uncharacterized protein (TIGR02300 family)
LALPELGAKQICPSCQAKFYDLNRRPAHCPKCSHDFDPDEAVRTRRVRARAAPAGRDIEDEAEDQVLETGVEAEEEEEDEAVTPELDAAVDDPVLVVDDEDGEVIAPPEDDLAAFQEEDDLDDEDSDVPFLEDEEDDFDDTDLDGLPGEGNPDD